MSSRISTLKRGFICLMRFVSSNSASVSVAVETKTIEIVSAIIRAMRLVWPEGRMYEAMRLRTLFALPT